MTGRLGSAPPCAAALLLLCVACGSSPSPATDRTALPDRAAPATAARDVPRASALVEQGERKLQAGDAAGARAMFEQAIAEEPEDPRAHLDLGLALEMLGDSAAAEEAYRRAIELQPDLAEALNNLAVLLRGRGELDEAVSLLRRAAASNPRSAAAHLNLALALEDAGDPQGAKQAYQKALELDPDALMTRVNLGLLLVSTGDVEDGKAELQRAFSTAQGNRAALLAIGNGLRRAGDAEAALAAMEAAVAAGGEPTPALLAELALAERAAGHREQAIATLQKALSLDRRYATAHYLLANMLAGDERFAEAKKHYRRYLELEPNGPHAPRAKERLRMVETLK